jgi:predicted nuclease of predicted toxin-antitoxin system
MMLLLDQGLPRSAAILLREGGIDAVHIGEIGLAAAEDKAIIERGRAESRVVVTLDADFHLLLALSGASSPSVIRIRIEGLRGEEVSELIRIILTEWGEALDAGAMLTVQPGRIRLRQLPIL